MGKDASELVFAQGIRPSAGIIIERCSSVPNQYFLTVRAWGKYTCSLSTPRKAVSKLAFGFALKDLPARPRNAEGGLLCQRHINRGKRGRPRQNLHAVARALKTVCGRQGPWRLAARRDGPSPLPLDLNGVGVSAPTLAGAKAQFFDRVPCREAPLEFPIFLLF